MTVPVAVGFVLTVLTAAAFFCLWWDVDSVQRDHHERLERIEGALVLEGEPLAISDAPTDEIPVVAPETVPAPVIDVAAGLRVKAAREANRPRPTPFPREQRQRGAHRR